MASRTVKVGYLAFAQGIASVSSILVASYLSRQLAENDYATYRQTFLSYRFVAPVLALGIPQALLYFLPNDMERRRGVVIESVSVLLLIGALFFLFFATFGNQLVAESFNNSKLLVTLRWFSPYALFILPVMACNSTLIATGRHQQSAIFSAVNQIGLATVVVFTIWLTDDVALAIKWLTVYSAILCTVAIYMLFKLTKGSDSTASRSGVKSLLFYSVPLGLGGAVSYLNMNLDKVVVSATQLPAEFSVYINGAFEVPLIGMLTGAASAVILPEMVASLKAGKREEALGLWKSASVKCAILLFPITAFLWAVAPDLMITLFGPKYEGSAEVFRLYILLIPVRIGFFGVIYQSCGKSALLLRRSLLALTLNLILTIPMTMWLGITGAALSTILVSWCVMVPYNCFECAKLVGVRMIDLFEWAALGRVMMSISILLVACCSLDRFLRSDLITLQFPVFSRLLMIGVLAALLVPILHLSCGVWTKEDIRKNWDKLCNRLKRS